MVEQGVILKAISGFYYVLSNGEIFECKARGSFRNKDVSPMVGDRVMFDNQQKIVEQILERKNEFLRPPMANLDQLFILASTVKPTPNILNIDKLTALCTYKSIEPIIVFTKTDLKSPDEFIGEYEKAGIKIFAISNSVDDQQQQEVLSQIREQLRGATSAFIGNTGVGKSSIINNIFSELELKTSHISEKLGRGRHTTRQIEMFYMPELDCMVADTPGFGEVETLRYQVILKEDVELCFPEFEEYLGGCKFTGCSHTVEKGCAVLDGLNNGKISKSRHESYVTMYNEAKNIKEWEL